MNLNKIWFSLFIVLFASGVSAQVNRYMVFFKDKAGNPFSISNPSLYLSAKAVERRSNQGISLTEIDLPVNPNYVEAVRNTGAGTFFKTHWMNGVLVQCSASLIPTIQALSCVRTVELVAPGIKLLGNGRTSTVSQNKKSMSTGTSTESQLAMLGIDQMHNDGFHGENMTIAILDAGFPGVDIRDPFQLLRNENRINLLASLDFVHNNANIFQYDSHGTEVLSTIAGFQEPTFTGGAYKAEFQLYITEDVTSEYRVEEYNWLFAAERADSAGANIISSSLGYNEFDDPSMDYTREDLNGKTAIITQAAQLAADRGILVICSAGNEGANSWGIITAPADAIDVLAIANVTLSGERNITSSKGPTADQRIKPDLAALGTNVAIITPSGTIGGATGTSLAAPLITGLATGIWQRYPDFTNKKIMEALKKSASQSNHPDIYLGYGIPNYKAAVNYLAFTPQTNIFEIYPNPFIDTLSIRPKSPDEISFCRFQCVTLQGQVMNDKIIEFSWLNPIYHADVSGLSPGLYIVRLWQNDKVYTFKIVKS